MTRPVAFALFSILAIYAISKAGTAATISYSDRSIFNNFAGPLVTEDFESAKVSGAVVNIDGPGRYEINSQTDNGVFSPGDIQRGLTVSYQFPFAVVNADYVSGTSKMVRDQAEGEQATDRDLVLLFESPIKSLGFDIFGAFVPGPSQPTTAYVAIDRPLPLLDEKFTFSLAESTGAFVGLISSEPFSSVSVNLGARMPAFIDNISFSTPVPTPTSSTLVLLALMVPVLRWALRSAPLTVFSATSCSPNAD